jgi:hypothetical protein
MAFDLTNEKQNNNYQLSNIVFFVLQNLKVEVEKLIYFFIPFSKIKMPIKVVYEKKRFFFSENIIC